MTKYDNFDSTDELMLEIQSTLAKSKDSSVNRMAESDVLYSTGFLPLDYKNGYRKNMVLPNGQTVKYDIAGILDGTSNMFIGRSGCGKSTLVYQIAANIIRNFDHGLMFVDLLEGGMLEERGIALTGLSRDEYFSKVKIRNSGITIESVYLQIKAIHDVKIANEEKFRYDTGMVDSFGRPITKFQPTVYVIDSIPLLTSAKLSEEETAEMRELQKEIY